MGEIIPAGKKILIRGVHEGRPFRYEGETRGECVKSGMMLSGPVYIKIPDAELKEINLLGVPLIPFKRMMYSEKFEVTILGPLEDA